jgi:hypothetical protein
VVIFTPVLEEVALCRFKHTPVELDADFAIVRKPKRPISVSVQSILGLTAAPTASDVNIKILKYCILEVISAFPPIRRRIAG